jgi:hypothetical protein
MAFLLPAGFFDFLSYFVKNIAVLFPYWFFETFSETLSADEAGWEGYCLVQRIEAVRLSRSGKRVRLTLRASSASDAYIDRIYISQPAPAGDPYDSAADLTQVTFVALVPPGALFIPAGQSVTLPLSPVQDITYNLDEGQPLLIAVDFSAAYPSGIKCTKAVPTEQACAYYKSGAEAAKPDRSGFTKYPGIYLIEKIEVSASAVGGVTTGEV